MGVSGGQHVADEWVTFQGGELEGKRPKALCPDCRQRLKQAAASASAPAGRPLCFQCYRADLDRVRTIRAAGALDTSSEGRFQSLLPFEPVNTVRLAALKADRAASRHAAREGAGQFTDRRRRAQIAARHALQQIFAGVKRRRPTAIDDGERVIASAVHAAELQLPEAWLPFVVSR
jgi:hypothetical protein